MGLRSSDLDESLVPLVFLVTLVYSWDTLAHGGMLQCWLLSSVGVPLGPLDHTIINPNAPWDLGYVSLHVGEWYLVWAK